MSYFSITYFFTLREKKRLNNFIFNKYFLTRDFTFRLRERKIRRVGQNEFMTRRFLYGSTRSYASNRKYRKRGNSEISVNERILRQTAIKELVSLRRLRALLWSIRKLTRSDKHVRVVAPNCISLMFKRRRMRKREKREASARRGRDQFPII